MYISCAPLHWRIITTLIRSRAVPTQIAWLRVDTQTILTIQSHVITKNHRMSVVHAEKRSWVLRIKDVKESDKGWYMCQINTDPMKSQTGYLDVVGERDRDECSSDGGVEEM